MAFYQDFYSFWHEKEEMAGKGEGETETRR